MHLLNGLKCPDRPHSGIAPSVQELLDIETQTSASLREQLIELVWALPERTAPRIPTDKLVSRGDVLALLRGGTLLERALTAAAAYKDHSE